MCVWRRVPGYRNEKHRVCCTRCTPFEGAAGLLEPQLARLGLALHQVVVELVRLLDDRLGLRSAERALAVAKAVDGLVIRGLVPAEPLANAWRSVEQIPSRCSSSALARGRDE